MRQWNIEVIFINDFASYFSEEEAQKRKNAELKFCYAIKKIIDETGITPQVNDWIQPFDENESELDICKISGRNFYPSSQTIRFEIE